MKQNNQMKKLSEPSTQKSLKNKTMESTFTITGVIDIHSDPFFENEHYDMFIDLMVEKFMEATRVCEEKR